MQGVVVHRNSPDLQAKISRFLATRLGTVLTGQTKGPATDGSHLNNRATLSTPRKRLLVPSQNKKNLTGQSRLKSEFQEIIMKLSATRKFETERQIVDGINCTI